MSVSTFTKLSGMVLFAALLLTNAGCKKDDPEPEHSCGHWEYEGEYGPEHWDELAPVCEEYIHCGGTAQSPVNIAGVQLDTTLRPLVFSYAPSATLIKNNGHTVEFEIDGGSTLELDGSSYQLLQFHFHGQSEHTIMGAANHLEAHFVHANAQGDRAVVGVMIKDGEENSFLASFMDNLPEQPGGLYPSAAAFNPAAFLPEDQDYFTYPGSLTTPPCDENVTWFVMEHPVEASSAQILRLKDIMPKNYRPLAPLAGRQIRHYRD